MWVGVAVPDALLCVAVGVAFALLVALADGLAEAVGDAEPDEAGVFVPVAEPVGVVLTRALLDRVRAAAEVPEEEGDGVVGCTVGVGVVVVGVGAGVGVCVAVGVGVGVGVGGGLGSQSG